MDPEAGPKLLQQAEKILLHPIHPHLVALCPTMDLIALVTDEESLDVYRFNGQRAFGLKRKSAEVSVDAICWEFNGQAIAVAWSDGFTDIISAETGKVIHKDLAPPKVGSETTKIAKIGWSLNFINVEAVKRRTGVVKGKKSGSTGFTKVSLEHATTDDWDAFKDETTLEDFLQRQPDLQALDIAPDLPDQLAMMDMESLLPKLPSIPMPPLTPMMRFQPQVDSGAFSSQVQVDSILHSHHMRDHNAVDMFVRCTDVGTVHPSIYDSLETVNVRLPDAWNVEKSRPVLHSSHPYSCSHNLLMKVHTSQTSKLALVPLTLGFISSAGIYLHLIASKTSQLQNLLQYIQQCLQRIQAFWKHSQDFPSKQMMNISETLEEKKQGTLVDNLYQLACTGYCPPVLKEWLVDDLSEAGHKRWDATVITSQTTLLQLLHENLLPAIDRCAIIISRLRGLAQYHDQGWIFTSPVSHFTALLTHLQNLRLLSHTTLLYAGDEKRQFAAFSKWLRYEIDYEAAEPGSQSREEMEGKDPGVDIALVLEYIQYGLMNSDLAPFLHASNLLESEQQSAGPATYTDTVKAVAILREGGNYKKEALCVEHALKHFQAGCVELFQKISQWQESNISMDTGFMLSEGATPEKMDMRMVFEADHITTYIAFVPASSASQLQIHRLTHTPTIDALPKALQAYAVTTLTFPDARVLDVIFADDTNLLILLQAQSQSVEVCSLVSLPYTPNPSPSPAVASTPTSNHPIPYTPILPSSYNASLLPSGHPVPSSSHASLSLPSSSETLKKYTKHVFEGRFTPLKLVVNGRKGRRVVLVLGSDRKHYRILDLDYNGKKAGTVKEEDAGDWSESDSSEGEDIDAPVDVDVQMDEA